MIGPRRGSPVIDVRPVLFINGYLLLVLAGAMLVPALVDFAYEDRDWRAFASAAMITAFAALGLVLGARPDGALDFGLRQAFLLTGSAWVLVSGFSAAPFLMAELDIGLADAVFEATSGITTTGATVLVGLDAMPRGILLWRALLHWLGGIGIIVMAVAILPMLRIGGMQLFRMESSDKTEKVKPRVTQVATGIATVYLSMTVLAVAALWLAGMTFFDAVCYAFSAVATGGFAPHDASGGFHESPLIEWLLAVFMFAGGVTFILFITPWKRGEWAILSDSQVRWYLLFVLFFASVVALWQWAAGGMEAHDAVRHATFNVVSVVTTTGFASTDYNAWGGLPLVVFFILSFIGGCTGSTSGGIKVFRWEVLFAMAGVHLKRLIHPHGIFVIDFNRRRISDQVVKSVLGFVIIYFLTFAVLALLLTMTGVDFVTAVTGAASTLSSVGPGLGDVIGPAGSYQPLPDAAKWLCSAGMLLGRLELFTVFVLFTRAFWRG